MAINHLQNGMILQVGTYLFGNFGVLRQVLLQKA